jgi:phosphoglycolate phosphatase-like HAD superfamily hydrolase
VSAALIFDFDGTLAHSWRAILTALNEVVPRHGIEPMSEEAWDNLRSLSMRAILGKFGIPSWRVPIVVMQVRRALIPHFAQVMPYNAMAETIHALAHEPIQLGILTSNRHDLVLPFLSDYYPPVFNFITVEAGLFGKAKKLRKLLRDHNLDPDCTAYVGDEDRDITAAREAHIKSVAVTWGFARQPILAEHQPTFLIDEPQQLLPIARSLIR